MPIAAQMKRPHTPPAPLIPRGANIDGGTMSMMQVPICL